MNGTTTDNVPKTWNFVQDVWSIVNQCLNPEQQRNSKVVKFLQPADLKKLVNIELSNESDSFNNLLNTCQQIVDYSVKTGHPYFLNQLFGGTDPYGLAASLLIESLNTNVYTYDVGPVLSLIEAEVLEKVAGLIKFDTGSYQGTFCPGGSIANMYSLSLARFHFNNKLKQTGLFGQKRFIIFTSEQSHYSVTKGAVFTGYGTDSVIKVRCLENGAMDPDDLQLKIADSIPLLVWSTFGSTVLGSMDNLEEISNICRTERLWLHVDACLGGALLLSKKADSVAWNWHKIIGAPIQTSIFITAHKNLLKECNSSKANYLFQPDKHYDAAYDSGDSSIMCSRRPDALKVWLIWKARGLNGLEELVDLSFENSKYLYDQMAKRDGFKMVLNGPQGGSTCFWVIPSRLRNMPENDEFWKEIQKVAPAMKLRMVQKGTVMLNYQVLSDKNLSNFFRITITCHPQMSRGDIDELIEELLSIGEDI